MTPSRLLARQSLAGLMRDRSVLILVAFFAAMVMVTAWLGWSATNTVDAIYADAAQYLTGAGQPVPSNPVSQSAPLAVLRNLGVYISLIGTFGAIVIGQLLIEADRRAGTLPLLGTRPFARRDYALGKMRALGVATGAMMAVAGLISVATLFTIPSLVVRSADLARLGLFLILGWAYITTFGLVALGAAARMPATASGLISASVVWLVVTFVLPELTANIHPTASINPVSTLAATPDSAFPGDIDTSWPRLPLRGLRMAVWRSAQLPAGRPCPARSGSAVGHPAAGAALRLPLRPALCRKA